jgi:F0F1-type ATP synthase assembly protein I
MQPVNQTPTERKNRLLNLTIASVAGQVGCLTTIIIIAAVLGGLWLDNYYQSKPMFTIGLLIASIPVSLAVMIVVVKFAVSKIKTNQSELKSEQKEVDLGKNS